MNIDSYAEMYAEHHAEAEEIAARLAAVGLEERAARIRSCGTYVTGYVCPDCGEYHVRATRLCRDRLCPNCGWTLARQRAQHLLRAVDGLQKVARGKLSHMVLTIQHHKGDDLRGLLLTLTRSYGLMLQSKVFGSCLGAVRSIEITSGENGFHPHIHALVYEAREYAGITPPLVLGAWRDALGANAVSNQVHYEAAYSREGEGENAAIFEAVKYAVKPRALLEVSEDALLHYAFAVKGIRMTAAHGLLKDALRRESEYSAPPWSREGCAVCGSDARQDYRALSWDHYAGHMKEFNPYAP